MPIKPIVQDRAELKKPCRETTPEEALPVIMDLMDTAHRHKKRCVGLAANQIGSNLRVFVVKVRGKFVAFINPECHGLKPRVKTIEGCLSFPGQETETRRYPLIMTSPPRGKKKGLVLDGIAAIAFQHELDHLNGVTI